MIRTAPAVFAVNKEYQIMVPVEKPSLMWVQVGDRKFYDAANGIMRSIAEVHRISVPMDILDEAGGYTVCEKEIIERKPYFTETKETSYYKFSFRPVKKTSNIRAYHIADAHNNVKGPVAAAETFGNIDFLIMNGDIPDHSGSIRNFNTVYEIAAAVTKGEIPIVFARGNHDLRGFFAEKFAEYTPSDRLNTYYTFTLGAIWGIILDCGEDKGDDHPEYGGTVACHDFRKNQIDFIKDVIKNKENEYEQDGVKYKLVISHNPFTYLQKPPFDIEREVYSKWAELLKENIKPDLMISGHIHKFYVKQPGDDMDHLGQPCPLVVGSAVKGGYFAGAGFVFGEDEILIEMTDSEGKTPQKTVLKRGKR